MMILLITQTKIICLYRTILIQAELSNSNLIQNANSLMAKNEAKIDTEVEFNWVPDVHPQNQTKFKRGY